MIPSIQNYKAVSSLKSYKNQPISKQSSSFISEKEYTTDIKKVFNQGIETNGRAQINFLGRKKYSPTFTVIKCISYDQKKPKFTLSGGKDVFDSLIALQDENKNTLAHGIMAKDDFKKIKSFCSMYNKKFDKFDALMSRENDRGKTPFDCIMENNPDQQAKDYVLLQYKEHPDELLAHLEKIKYEQTAIVPILNNVNLDIVKDVFSKFKEPPYIDKFLDVLDMKNSAHTNIVLYNTAISNNDEAFEFLLSFYDEEHFDRFHNAIANNATCTISPLDAALCHNDDTKFNAILSKYETHPNELSRLMMETRSNLFKHIYRVVAENEHPDLLPKIENIIAKADKK